MKVRVIDSSRALFACYETLQAGDIVAGRIRLHAGQEHLLLDLTSRGVRLLPSATSQLCSRSKVYQAAILGSFMLELTRPVYSMHDMLDIVTAYGRAGVGPVVCKLDRANGGLGILRFSSIEDVFSQAALKTLAFPFVVQPFAEDCRDVRVVVLGEAVEAYQRHNPDNFRHNLHCGGTGRPWDLTADQLDFCTRVMERAGFPYAHVDLLILADGTYRLAEINLRGGLRGAVMDQKEYVQRVKKIQEKEVTAMIRTSEG
jgi:ribosomal protein S6--L-glutamate ligase